MECRAHGKTRRAVYLPPEVLDQVLLHVGARDVAMLRCSARLLSALTIDDVIVRLVDAICAPLLSLLPPLLRPVGGAAQLNGTARSRGTTLLRDASGAGVMMVRCQGNGGVTLLWRCLTPSSRWLLEDYSSEDWSHAEITRFTLPDVVRLVTRVYHSRTPELAALAPGGRVAALRDVVRGWTPQCWIERGYSRRVLPALRAGWVAWRSTTTRSARTGARSVRMLPHRRFTPHLRRYPRREGPRRGKNTSRTDPEVGDHISV
jgi:hypothetical protein